MISEVDIRDWEKVDFSRFTPNPQNVYQMVPFDQVIEFVEQVRKIRDAQIRATAKQLPALFRKGEE